MSIPLFFFLLLHHRFQFLYENENYDKPFFCTYFKASMFTIYLIVLGLIAPWKESCNRNGNYSVRIGLICISTLP